MVLQAKQVRAEMAKQEVPQFEMRHRMALALEYGDVSVIQMSKALGISRTTISNFLHGRTEPRRAFLVVWADVCKVPQEWLIGDETVEPEPPKKPAKKAAPAPKASPPSSRRATGTRPRR